MQDTQVLNLSDLVGHSPMLEQLMRSVQAGRIVHALLFVGPAGTGRHTAAGLLARAMLCTGDQKPCGVCPACKMFLSGTHPDVQTFVSQKASVGVDLVRELIDYLALKPYAGGLHVAILERAEKMTPQAQNALLKTLEAPPGDAVIFLIAENTSALLPTVLSRCQRVRFNGLSAEDCAEALRRRGLAPARAELLAEISRGSVGRALEIDADEEYLPMRERVFRSLEALQGPDSVARAVQALGEGKDSAAQILEIMELIALDLMRLQNGGEVSQRADAERLQKVKLKGSALLDGVLEMRAHLSANMQWTSALEYMYFALTARASGGKYQWQP